MADLILGGIILLAAIRGFFKGFLGEFMSLVGWAICLVLVIAFAEPVARMIPADSLGQSGRYLVSFAGLLLLGLIAWGAFQKYLLESIRDRGISTIDSLLGGLLGGVFGSILCVLGLMLLREFLSPSPLWWQESLVISKLMQFEHLVSYLLAVLWEQLGILREPVA